MSKEDILALENQRAMLLSARELVEILLYRLKFTNAFEFIPSHLRRALQKEMSK